MSIDVAHLCDCIYASRRGLAALLILNGGNARPERRISRSTDSHVFFLCNLDPESLSGNRH